MCVTIIFLEALNEAPVKIQCDLVTKLASLNAKLFITSRPLEAVIANFPHAHHLPIVARPGDIETYLTHEMGSGATLGDAMKKAGKTWREGAIHSVGQKCHGSYVLPLQLLGYGF
jgi:hypothetical protein